MPIHKSAGIPEPKGSHYFSMHKEYTPETLMQSNKGLCTEIEKAVIAVIPHIHRHVADTLHGQPPGTIVVHSTFFRLQDHTEQIFFIETQLQCVGDVDDDHTETIVFRLQKILFHDSIQSYFEARNKCVDDSQKHFGNSLRPIKSEYNGIEIHLN